MPRGSTTRLTKCFYTLLAATVVYIFSSAYWISNQNPLAYKSFTDSSKCPICFGQSICLRIEGHEFLLQGLTQLSALGDPSRLNTYLVVNERYDMKFTLKRFGNENDFKTLDARICKDIGKDEACTMSNFKDIYHIRQVQNIRRHGLLPQYLFETSSPMFVCPTQRLVDRVLEYYQEKITRDKTILRDMMQVWVTALTNSEPLIYQTFPSSEGWPFPRYHGACGRVILVDYIGYPLSDFLQAPWQKRVDLAYQLLKIAETLTHSSTDFLLYWADVSFSDFAVDPAGKIYVVQGHKLLVVDKKEVETVQSSGWNETYVSGLHNCPDGTVGCIVIATDQLCKHTQSDHNYFMVCRHLLSSSGEYDTGLTSVGLLHNTPKTADENWKLRDLLKECVVPSQPNGRIQAVQKMLKALEHMRQSTTDSR